jgi:diguanylate cyclase (GGDEF)-like protein
MFLSADSLPADKQKALALGAFDYIQKPFKPEHLRARVRSTLQAAPISKDKSRVDPLTGLWNKRYLDIQIKEQFVLAQLASQPLACIVIAIDQLGFVHSKYGSAVGNQVTRRVANVIASNGGMYATNCALADGRFAVLLRRSDRFDAAEQAERLRSYLQQKLVLDHNAEVNVTCSFGVCDNLIASATTLFDRAGRLLNSAINRGGNCVSVARRTLKVSA